MTNKDERVIEDFGDEWTKFNEVVSDEEKLGSRTLINTSIFSHGISYQKMLSVLIWGVVREDGPSSLHRK